MPTNPSYDELQKRIKRLERIKNDLEQSIDVLKNKENIFHFFYKEAPVAYQSLDENGDIVDVNDAWLNILGYDRDEVIGKSFGNFIHPAWKTHFKENFPRFKAVGEVLGVEFEMIKKDGSFLIASFSGRIDTDCKGRFNRTYCFFEDITELKQTKDAFQQSEETARALLNASTESAFLIDLDGNFIDMNEITAKRLKYNAADLIGKNCYDYIPPKLAQSRRDIVKELLRKKEPIRFEDIRDGIHFDHHVYPVLNSQGDVYRLAIFAKDITSQRKYEKELVLKNKLSKVILTSDGVQMYSEILSMILKKLRSKYGYLGYIDDNGDLVCPSMTDDVWDQCRIEDKTIVFPQPQWGGLWGRSLRDKTLHYSNQPLHPPNGHVPLTRAIACPIIHNTQLIGQIAVANKLTNYTKKDLVTIENIALFMAPILATRLEKDKIERKRKLAEKTLRESEKRYRSLFSDNHAVMLVIDPKTADIVNANPAAISYYGWSFNELTRKKITDINLLPESHVFRKMQNAKEKQKSRFEFRHRLANGDIRDVEVYSGPIKIHENELLVSIIHDTTDKNRAERQLITMAQEWQTTFDTTNDAIFLLDKDMRIKRVNKKAKQLFKDLDGEIVGKFCHSTFWGVRNSPHYPWVANVGGVSPNPQ